MVTTASSSGISASGSGAGLRLRDLGFFSWETDLRSASTTSGASSNIDVIETRDGVPNIRSTSLPRIVSGTLDGWGSVEFRKCDILARSNLLHVGVVQGELCARKVIGHLFQSHSPPSAHVSHPVEIHLGRFVPTKLLPNFHRVGSGGQGLQREKKIPASRQTFGVLSTKC
jgi:hypothetical protein